MTGVLDFMSRMKLEKQYMSNLWNFRISYINQIRNEVQNSGFILHQWIVGINI